MGSEPAIDAGLIQRVLEMFRSRVLKASAGVLALSFVFTQQASAACTRLAFSVNDYGKDGPTKDAKNLLDKYVAKWAADRKITGYKMGPKEVTCELFIDLIVFDEYTCKAAATVCWNGPLPPGHTVDASAAGPLVNKTSQSSAPRPKPASTSASTGGTSAISTGSVKTVPATPKAPAAAPSAPAAPAAAPARAPAAN
jgi:hypothetical protein